MHEIISVPATDLRDDSRKNLVSQLRLGERVRIVERAGDWLRVEALDQPQFSDGWGGYRGWIAANAVRPWRETVVAAARACLGWSYLWGGLGDGAIDCSGLVHLAYRAAGIEIPRDACDQARRCRPVDILLPADLLFMSKRESPQKVVHVMMYEGKDLYIEATSYTGDTRTVDLETRLGQPAPDYWVIQPSCLAT